MTLKYLQNAKKKKKKKKKRINDPEGLENKIYTMTKGRETFYGDHTVPITSYGKVQHVQALSFGSKDYTKELKTVEYTSFLAQTS